MTYPEINLSEFNKLYEIIGNANAEATYLDPGICPYDEGTLAKLRDIVGWTHPVARASVEKDKNPVGRPSKKTVLPIDDVEKEINEIRQELGQLKLDGKNLETSDRIQIIKTRAALVEKIIAMKERTSGLKKQAAFISTVIGIMEDVLEQKQKDEVIKKLEPYLDD